MSVLDKLTEGIVNRDLQKEGSALLNKWEKTGLLEGLESESKKSTMARLLENQARELLREASTMAGGDVEGFASVAFPIVRRVFGSLIANDLVSVQPMSLPSGLIFFLDFTTSTNLADGADGIPKLGYGQGGNDTNATATDLRSEDSIYGGNRVGSAITGGVDLSKSGAERGPYGLNNAYSSPVVTLTNVAFTTEVYGTFMNDSAPTMGAAATLADITKDQFDNVILEADPDFVSGTTNVVVFSAQRGLLEAQSALTSSSINFNNLVAFTITTVDDTAFIPTTANARRAAEHQGHRQVRRLTKLGGPGGAAQAAGSMNINSMGNPSSDRIFFVIVSYDGTASTDDILTAMDDDDTLAHAKTGTLGINIQVPITDAFVAGTGLGSLQGADLWALENTGDIPEIDIKVDSIAVTAITKKLKAKWTPELGQDLNAYHNLDAEVELTSILSEQIALEIDREILADLVRGGTADTLYWSRRPGHFIDRVTGRVVGDDYGNESLMGLDFTGTVSEWYETLIETINDVSAQIHRKTLRGGANFVVCSPEVANILEFTAGFRANVTHDSDKGTVGAVNVGSISKKWDVYVDPYFPRQVVLVGRKGGSFLESGYVYAPYVPLQVTPTIFGVEDFVPRKGVMTRYAKKMVRPDMYGLVIVTHMSG